jgi:PAS domain S-box-containing protein
MATGKPLVVNDVHTSDLISEALRTQCLQLQLISFIATPVDKQGETRGMFWLVQNKPRKWTDIEVKLARDSAERICSAVEYSQAEKAIRTSEENYRAIVDQTIAAVMKTDLEGNVIFCNRRFAEMLGYPPDGLLKTNTEDLIYKKDIEQNRKMFDRLKKEGRAYHIEKRLVRRDGSYIWVNNQVSPIFNQNGEPYAAVIVSIDINEQKAIEKHKDDFISVASHELRTPLTSIKVYTDFLIELFEDEKNEYHGGLLKKLNLQVNKMIKLVAGLLDTGRIATQKLALQDQKFDLNELIKETVADAQLTATRHKLLFEPGNISPVAADRQRIAQVITNLLSNAVKYSPSGKKVIVTSESVNGEVKVSVRDFGIGISEEAREKIFKRFNRGDAPGDIGGLGLGLYISIEIIKLHSGRMGVETPPKEGNGRPGSIVYFVLPCVPPAA